MSRQLVFRPGFHTDLLEFDSGTVKQILGKVGMLLEQPEEAGKAKARVDGRNDGLHRLRSGDFRIFYTYDAQKVSLWTVRRKTVKGQYRGKKGGDVTYDGLDEVVEDDLDVDLPPSVSSREGYESWVRARPELTPLPEKITTDLLQALGVPFEYHARLAAISDQESLLACPGVPEDHLLAIDRHMFEEPIDVRAFEPELIALGGVDDLFRMAEGEVVPFLLRLNPEQERLVRWGMDADGPTLVKGGPGTGKSTVAIHRAREMVRVLRSEGVEHPRVLFSTYTNALVTFSQQLLTAVLGDEAGCVEVKTADSLAGFVLGKCGFSSRRPDTGELEAAREAALAAAMSSGNALQQAALKRSLSALRREYLFEEIETVIQGRGIDTFDAYLASPRHGRRTAHDAAQRRAIWTVAAAYADHLQTAGLQTWPQSHTLAARLAAAEEPGVPVYDAVIVDEAQDLDHGSLRLLAEVCVRSNRLFLTADADQAIYQDGFSWSAVHEHLRFDGRTAVLHANHRSTREITEAARDHLAAGVPEALAPEEQSFVHFGPLPAMRKVETEAEEDDLVARFIKGATRELRLTIGSGAVLVPDSYVGEPLASSLTSQGVPATYRDSKRFQLDDNTVAVLPLVAAKGLEFPVVALAGFGRSNWPHIPFDLEVDFELEALIRARRTLFVAMTRAMRALLVVVPAHDDSMLYDGFDRQFWNIEP